jgi:hypothetical protein
MKEQLLFTFNKNFFKSSSFEAKGLEKELGVQKTVYSVHFEVV